MKLLEIIRMMRNDLILQSMQDMKDVFLSGEKSNLILR